MKSRDFNLALSHLTAPVIKFLLILGWIYESISHFYFGFIISVCFILIRNFCLNKIAWKWKKYFAERGNITVNAVLELILLLFKCIVKQWKNRKLQSCFKKKALLTNQIFFLKSSLLQCRKLTNWIYDRQAVMLKRNNVNRGKINAY